MASNSNGTPKWILYVGGIASIAAIIGVIIAYFNYVHPTGTTIDVINMVGTSTPVISTPTSNPVTSTPTSNPIWNVILNRLFNRLTYNNYTVIDTQGHHLLIVEASFENVSSTTQSLSGNLFDLQDEYSNHYSEDQASNPGNHYAVDPGQSIQTDTAYVVPNSSCKFELSFIAGSSVVAQWNISSGYCS